MPNDSSSTRRPRLSPAVAEVRLAVRQALHGHFGDGGTLPSPHGSPETTDAPATPLVLVALSGGPDSLALAAAVAFESRALGIRAGAVVIDHALQADSADTSRAAASRAEQLGLDPVVVRRVSVSGEGGPEASARRARYRAIGEVAEETRATAVLFGHTLDDQAETVLLGLARGSGAASLQGMAPTFVSPLSPHPGDHGASVGCVYLRPLLGVRRAATHAACEAEGLSPWIDPHNADPAFSRVRVRNRVLPVLEAELGPGIAEALARTADQAREDAEAFDLMIEEFIEEICEPAEAGISVEIGALEANPAALRNRIIRYVALSEFGVSLSRGHTLAIAALVTDWRGQAAIDVPGIVVSRENARLVFTARPAEARAAEARPAGAPAAGEPAAGAARTPGASGQSE